MKVAITGSSGLIGTALEASLTADGHQVLRLVRRYPKGPDEVAFDPIQGTVDTRALAGIDALVNLAGAPLDEKRWNDEVKGKIRASRVGSTRTVSRALAATPDPKPVLVSASGINAYGDDRGEEVLTETSQLGDVGDSFLAGVCRDWESATAEAEHAGVRVAHLRTGLVISADGGLLKRLLPFFRAGAGGPLGRGRMWWSPIALADEVAAIRFLIDRHDQRGVYNLTCPQPVRNKDFSRALGKALGRPSLLPVPPPALQALYGEFSDVALGSLRVLPQRLTDAGFTFAHPDAGSIIKAALA